LSRGQGRTHNKIHRAVVIGLPHGNVKLVSRRFFERQVANVTYHTQDRAFRIVRPHNSPNGILSGPQISRQRFVQNDYGQ